MLFVALFQRAVVLGLHACRTVIRGRRVSIATNNFRCFERKMFRELKNSVQAVLGTCLGKHIDEFSPEINNMIINLEKFLSEGLKRLNVAL